MPHLSARSARAQRARLGVIVLFVIGGAATSLTGCGGTHPPQLDPPQPSTVAAGPTDPAGQLAGLAAAALDHRFVAGYVYRVDGHGTRTIVVDVATDRSWSVYVPAGALGGGGDVTVLGTTTGTYQCLLGGSRTTPATPSASPATLPNPASSPGASASPGAAASPGVSPSPTPPPGPVYIAPACVRIGTAKALLGGRITLPATYVPPIVHAFTDWLTVLSNRSSAILVSHAKAPSTAAGSCFSVEPSATSIAPVIDAGIFCFRADGTLTSVTLDRSSVALQGSPAPPPPTVSLPAPETAGPAAPLTAPPAA